MRTPPAMCFGSGGGYTSHRCDIHRNVGALRRMSSLSVYHQAPLAVTTAIEPRSRLRAMVFVPATSVPAGQAAATGRRRRSQTSPCLGRTRSNLNGAPGPRASHQPTIPRQLSSTDERRKDEGAPVPTKGGVSAVWQAIKRRQGHDPARQGSGTDRRDPPDGGRCDEAMRAVRDGVLLLLGFAGVIRRSRLVGRTGRRGPRIPHGRPDLGDLFRATRRGAHILAELHIRSCRLGVGPIPNSSALPRLRDVVENAPFDV